MCLPPADAIRVDAPSWMSAYASSARLLPEDEIDFLAWLAVSFRLRDHLRASPSHHASPASGALRARPSPASVRESTDRRARSRASPTYCELVVTVGGTAPVLHSPHPARVASADKNTVNSDQSRYQIDATAYRTTCPGGSG